MSGLRETFIKRYVVERTNKAELRPEEQSEKAESCQEKTEIHKKNRILKNHRVDKLGSFMSLT